MDIKDNDIHNSNLSDCYSGHGNLEVLSQTNRFNDWIYEQILPVLRGDILEVGSGVGTFSKRIIRDLPDSKITLTDVSPYYVKQLEQEICNNYKNNTRKVSCYKLDLENEADYEKIGYGKFDSIVAINVLEHVKRDEFALRQLYKMLRTEGILILLVPCHKFLYNAIDRKIGHFRRYTKNDLESKIKTTPFVIERLFYFNMLGIIGWYLNGTLTGNSKINGTAYRIFDKMVPLLKYAEIALGKKVGLDIICYLKKYSK